MNSLSRKLTFSYGLLTLILLGVSFWGVYNFARLGRSINTILVNNYKSIIASENMKEALERIDSAAMFFIAGHPDKAREQYALNAGRFDQEFQIAAHNITEPGEDKIVADINAQFSAYRPMVAGLLSPAPPIPVSQQNSLYFDQLEPRFEGIKNRLDDLLRLNQQAMVSASARASSEARRAEVSTAGLAGLAFLFALLFAWRFTKYVVKPIATLTENVKRIGEGDLDRYIDLTSQDEIGVLAAEFNRMTTRLRDLRKSDYWRMLIERKKSDAVIDSIYEPVIVTDAHGHITKVNRAAEQLFGNGRKTGGEGESGGDDVELTLTGFSAGDRIVRAVKDAVALQRPVAGEDDAALVPIKVGGTERSYRLRTTPMRDADGRLLGAVTVLEDITSIREVDRLKTEFISVASNKLRAPLNDIELALYAAIQQYGNEVPDKHLELLYDAKAGAEQLDELMSDLLDLAEIESGARKLNLEPLRPVDLVRAAIEHWRSAAECKHIKLEQQVLPDLSRVKADENAVKRIFNNLLSNAIRHTDRDGHITIGAFERENRIIFAVRDTGEGIPEKYLPNIFGRFVHVEGERGGGTGLGLALVKRLAESMGGQVGVESHLGEGAVFKFSLAVAFPSGPNGQK